MKALLFDLDGTLIDSSYQHVASWTHAFRDAGLRIPCVEIHRRIGMNARMLIDAIDRVFALELTPNHKRALEEAQKAHYGLLMHEVVVTPGADRIARELDEVGVRVAIVTGAGRAECEHYFAELNLARSTVIVTREDDARSKPASTSVERALKELRVAPHEAAVVGDSTWGYAGLTHSGLARRRR